MVPAWCLSIHRSGVAVQDVSQRSSVTFRDASWKLMRANTLVRWKQKRSYARVVLTKLDSGRQVCGWPGNKTNFSISWLSPSTELRIGRFCEDGRDGIETGLAVAVPTTKRSQIKDSARAIDAIRMILTMNWTQCLRADGILDSPLGALQSLSNYTFNFDVIRIGLRCTSGCY